MVMQGSVGTSAVIEAADISDITATPISLYGAHFACISVVGTASGSCDLTINLSCTGTSQIFPSKANETLTFAGLTTGDFVVAKKIDLRGYSEIKFLDSTVSGSATITGAKIYFEPVY